MKKFFGMAVGCLFAVSCSNESVETVGHEKSVAPVRVHVSNFSVSMEDFSEGTTRAAQDVASFVDVNAVTVAFYDGSTEVAKVTQQKASMPGGATFGELNLSLPMGSYTMVAVAYKTSDTSGFALTSASEAAYTGAHAFDTFSATQTVNITSTAAVDISATLERVASLLKVISTDGKTANVVNVRMTLSAGGRDFDPGTGLAISDAGIDNTVGNSVAAGTISQSLTYFFLASEEETMDVTIETLDDGGNTLFSKKVVGVPFKRNRKTVLTGPMYTNSGVGGAFKVSTEWESDYNVGF